MLFVYLIFGPLANFRVVTDGVGEAEYITLNSGGVGRHVKNSKPLKNGHYFIYRHALC
jgi:hypothetical protein